MTIEPIGYRLRKRVVQNLSKPIPDGDQHDRINETEWDVLLVLDACRYDTFSEVCAWPCQPVKSPGSSTPEWLRKAKGTGIFDETTVVTANGQYEKFDVGPDEIVRLYESEWRSDLGNIPPEPVLDEVGQRAGGGPVIGHVLPPHGPYIATVGDGWWPCLPDVEEWRKDDNENGWPQGKYSPQITMAAGLVDGRMAKRAYRASVESTWDVCSEYVASWIDDGLTVVVTSDHGELFGSIEDFGLYAHPSNIKVPNAVTVPWAEFGRTTDAVAASVEEQLEHLGYA